MSSKKYTLLIAFLCLMTSGLFAQVGSSYDVQDSSVVPGKRLPQHTEFMANNYPYPAKPRNQWEIGLKGGAFSVSSDVRSRFPGWGVGLHVRKALGYVFSLRAEVDYGTTKGLNFQPTNSYGKNPAWSAYNPATQAVFYNYKTDVGAAHIDGVITLNNVRFHKAKTGFNLYAFAGLGGMIYNTKINALNGNTPYNFNSITGPFDYSNRKDVRKQLKNMLDGSYETKAEQDPSQPKLFGTAFRPTANFGLGMQFKLSNRWSLSLEDNITITKTDLLDGQQWQANYAAGGAVPAIAQTRDYDSYNFLSLGINFSIGSKSVQPLWWINPLDYVYSEVNKPRHMKLPKPVLDDADGDGVTDQFDQEPNTPAGAPVDSHGVSRDTDGDGVPDYKDKELITPTQCQPVDADGIGKCPPPACCEEINNKLANWQPANKCGIGNLPSVTFKAKSISLSNDAKAVLAGAAQQIKNNPSCKIAVVGYCSSSKAEQQSSWDRVNAVISYLVEKEGISQDRFIFKYGEAGGDCNTVDLRDGTGEEGPTTVPAPHPNLRGKK